MYAAVVSRVLRMFDARNVYRRVTGRTLALVKENMSPGSHAPRRWARDFDCRRKKSGYNKCKRWLFTYFVQVC